MDDYTDIPMELEEEHPTTRVWANYLDAVLALSRLGDADAATGMAAQGGKLRVRSDAEMEDLPPVAWLVDGVLPVGGLAAIYGAPGSGKSFVALDLAFSIATGQYWMARRVEQGGTLYVSGEGHAGLGQRTVAWKQANDRTGQSLGLGVVSEAINLLDPTDVARVVDAAIAPQVAKPIRLVVLDTLAMSMSGGDENDARDMGAVISAAHRIRIATGACVLLVHHTRKDSSIERGSSALRGAVDSLILCREGDEGRELVCEKQKDGVPFLPIPFTLVAEHGSCVVSSSGAPDNLLSGMKMKALKALDESFTARGATASEWCVSASSVAPQAFYRCRTWLVREGYVAENGSRYTVTPSGKYAVRAGKSVGSAPVSHAPKAETKPISQTNRVPDELWEGILDDADLRIRS